MTRKTEIPLWARLADMVERHPLWIFRWHCLFHTWLIGSMFAVGFATAGHKFHAVSLCAAVGMALWLLHILTEPGRRK